MASADFDQAIAESHAATDGVLKGNPDGFKALYSRSEYITLGNPFGGFARGWDQVVEQLERASSYYRDGEATGFESVAQAVGSSWPPRSNSNGPGPRWPAARREGICCSSYVDLPQRRGRLATHPSSCRSQSLPPDRRVCASGLGVA
jgi:hypothetical protein